MTTFLELIPVRDDDPGYGQVITKGPDGRPRYFRLPTAAVEEMIAWRKAATERPHVFGDLKEDGTSYWE